MADVPVKAVEFMAEVKSIKSMADNSVDVTINVPENYLAAAQQILANLHTLTRVWFLFDVPLNGRPKV